MKFKLPTFLKLSNLLQSKKIVIAFSIILSFTIWLTIMVKENPERQKTFHDITIEIPTEITDGKYALFSEHTQKVSVTVTAPNYVVSSLSSEDFVFDIDTTNVLTNGVESEVEVNARCEKTGIKQIECTPNKFKVIYDSKLDQNTTIDISAKIRHVTNDSIIDSSTGLNVSTASVVDLNQNTVSTISISGSKSEFEKIGAVEAVAEINETLTADKIFACSSVILYDKDDATKVLYRYNNDGSVYDGTGNLVSIPKLTLGLKVSDINILQKITQIRKLPIEVLFKNLPEGFDISAICSVNPGEISIEGAPDIVNSMSSITTDKDTAIDIRTIKANTKTANEIPCDIPTDIVVLDENGSPLGEDEGTNVTVNINTSGYREKVITINTLKFKNSDGSVEYANIEIKNVRICGPASVINKIKQTDFYAYVDLSGEITKDNIRREVTIMSDVYKDVWQIGSYTITISLS